MNTEVTRAQEQTNDQLRTQLRELSVEIRRRTELNNHLKRDLHNLLAHCPGALVILDEHNNILRHTPNAAEIIAPGYEFAPIAVGASFNTLDIHQCYPDLANNIHRCLRGTREIEMEIQNDAGVFYLLRMRRWQVPGTTQHGTLLSFTDISEQKTLHEAAVRTEQLAVLGKLAGGVAHEFNNLNAIVLANLGVIEAQNEFSAESQQHFDQVKEAILRSKEITYELLSLSRAESPEEELFNVCACVTTAISLEHDQMHSDGIEIQLEKPESAVYVRGSAGSLTRAVINLLVNSAQALVDSRSPKITINIHDALKDQRDAPADHIEIVVADNGPGISPADLNRVFDPFFTTKGPQARAGSSMQHFQGTGLGLSLVKNTVERHGGTIEAQSTKGQGASFTLRLPKARRERQPGTQAQRANSARDLSGIRCLVVDDEENIRHALDAILAHAGADTDTASGVEEAKELLQHNNYDLLLLDWAMPAGGGAEVMSVLADHAPSVTVVISGARVPDVLPVPAPMLSSCHVMRKPFEVNQLLEFLNARLAEVNEVA